MSRRSLLNPSSKTALSARSLGIIFENVQAEEEEPLPSIEDQFRRGEVETVEKVLDRIEAVSAKRVKEGFSKRNFEVGTYKQWSIDCDKACNFDAISALTARR